MESIDLLKEQLEEQSRYIMELREAKHDIWAHFVVLRDYLEKNEVDKAKDYLSKIMGLSAFQNKAWIDVGNELINAILAAGIHRSKEEIELQTSGLIPEELAIEETDLCSLFSNLISNSVEACEKLTHTDRAITLTICEKGTALTITMTNPIEWELNSEILGKDTTKEDKISHGHGVRNIQKVVKKYNGTLKYDIQNGTVLVKIVFHNVV